MNKKIIIALIAVVAVLGLMLGLYFGTRQEQVEGQKSFTIKVVHSDGTELEKTVKTTQTYLAHALIDEKILTDEGLDDGMYLTVDSETASWEKNQSYWGFYVGEDYAVEGMNTTVIQDGAVYKLVYTIG